MSVCTIGFFDIYIYITATRYSRNRDLLATVEYPKFTVCFDTEEPMGHTNAPHLPHSTCRFCPTLTSTESKTTGALETRHTHTGSGAKSCTYVATCMYCRVIRSKRMESLSCPAQKDNQTNVHPFISMSFPNTSSPHHFHFLPGKKGNLIPFLFVALGIHQNPFLTGEPTPIPS